MDQKQAELERIRREAERRGFILLPIQTPLCPDCKAFALTALNEHRDHQACA